MKSPNNGGDRAPTGQPLSANETSGTGTELYLTELLGERVPWGFASNPCCFQDYRFLPTNSQQGPVLKKMTTQLVEHGEEKPVPT